MGLVEAEQWWERWQLRVLVLGSLSLQLFLLVAAALRRRRTSPWFRLLTWAAYMGSDALAIYALAMLFTRHKKRQPAGGVASPSPAPAHGSAELEALWAPVLLLHLGGQDGITAYSIQDNEMWRRHLFTAASQVAIAVYVFRKSWPQGGDGRVLAAAILIFFPGILKCLGKPWALSKSSASSTAAAVGAKISKEEGPNTDNSWVTRIQDFLHKASLLYASNNDKQEEVGAGGDDHKEQARLLEATHHLFVDLPYPYSVQLDLLKHLLHRGPKGAHGFVRSGLSGTFDRLYTAGNGYGGGYLCSALLRAVLVLLLASSVAVVSRSRSRGAYAVDSGADLKVTFLLLSCTAGLEVVSAVTMVYFGWIIMVEPPWPDQLAQCNLVGYLVHNEASHRWARRLASLLGCQPFLDWLWCTAPSRTARPSPSCSSDGITELIYTHIAVQWKIPPAPDGETASNECCYYIKHTDTATYRRFSGSRGEWTLGKEACGGLAAASSSVQRPFDESVMVWHLATDMCFFFHSVGGVEMETQKRQCRAISNYMAYLLLVNPEMLMPGARRRIFTVAYYQVREAIVEGESPEDEDDDVFTDKKKLPLPPGGHQDMARKLIQKARKTAADHGKDDAAGVGPARSRNLVQDAWALAKELMEMEQEAKTWRVIRGVWVEMLCFSASRCRGYLHAKSLATGGEYLSYVWLLRAFMGMETLAHAMQATDEGDLGAAHPPTVVTGSDHA